MGSKRNVGIDLDIGWISDRTYVSPSAIQEFVDDVMTKRTVEGAYRIGSLLRAITCIDLTTLCGDDCFTKVERLCCQAVNPISHELLNAIQFKDKDIHTAAVCVYPKRVKDCKEVLSRFKPNVAIASVAGGFPSGQYPIRCKLLEIEAAIEEGATEVDVVISRDYANSENWQALYDEVKQMKKRCGDDVLMKTILATGELESLRTVYKTSLVCMMAGSDFIKTSTGMEKINATLPAGAVMARAIRDYERETGFQVGFKPAGGIRTAKDAIDWQILMKETLGNSWMFPDLFRIGASALLRDIQEEIYRLLKGHSPPSPYPFEQTINDSYESPKADAFCDS